jgi:acylphosphatase
MEAEKRNIHGFVKNRTEDEVEAVLLGEDKNVDELIKLVRKGPSSARVENLNIQNYQKEYLRKSFDILHD